MSELPLYLGREALEEEGVRQGRRVQRAQRALWCRVQGVHNLEFLL